MDASPSEHAGRRRPGGLGPALVVAVIGLLAVSGALDGLWGCPFKRVTGIPCPGCGMTRAVRFLLHGDVASATAMHPLVWLFVPLGVAFAALEVRGYVRERVWGTALRPRWARVVAAGALGALVVVWGARFFGAFGGPVK